jgi:molybdopterin/thiamine biosynthesis adenylyltransferase
MIPDIDLILIEPHEAAVRSLLDEGAGVEAAGYLLFGVADIAADPWTGNPRRRFISHAFHAIDATARVSASSTHVTWTTDGFMRLLGESVDKGLVPAIVHTHPDGEAAFSVQDDRNEAELARTAEIKGALGLISIVISGDGAVAARFWQGSDRVTNLLRVFHSGARLSISCGVGFDAPAYLDRQIRLFGENTTDMIRQIRCGIAGGGATGSATLPLLMRLGVQNAVMFDRDLVELTNLNRLHGACMRDADECAKKIDVHHRMTVETGLGINLVTMDAWAGDPETWDALKACDVIFSCTDDHAGRLFLNRFARYYGIPVIDMGLAIQRRMDGNYDLFGRVSTLVAGHPCLLCSGHIDPRRAREEKLQRHDPEGYERLKAEAYVLGEGNPSPAVVTFTSETAAMAVNELLVGITNYRPGGMAATHTRRFHAGDDRFSHTSISQGCPACGRLETLGRGDIDPFLDMVI